TVGEAIADKLLGRALHQCQHQLSHKFFFSSGRRHTRFSRDWSSDVCSSDLATQGGVAGAEDATAEEDVAEAPADEAADEDMAARSEERRVGKVWKSGRLADENEEKTMSRTLQQSAKIIVIKGEIRMELTRNR